MHNLLITGGAGFIGSNFIHYWLKNNPNDQLIILDKLTYAGNLNNLSNLDQYPTYHFYQGDINDQSLLHKLFQKHAIDTIVNFAAESHVDKSIHDSRAFIDTNVIGTHTLLNIAKHYWLDKWENSHHRFHQISTDEVFGSLSPDGAPFTEEHPYETNSPYAASKAAADHFVRAFHKTYGLNITISHCSNNYGPYHYPEKLIPLCLIKILQGESIPVYGDGQQIRDWLHVIDHCRGIEAVLKKGIIGESYNIGGHDGEMINLTLVNCLCELVDNFFQERPSLSQQYPNAAPAQRKSSKTLITHITDRLGHDRRYAINSSKIQRELGFKYTISLKEGLHDTVNWYLNQETWWKQLSERAAESVK